MSQLTTAAAAALGIGDSQAVIVLAPMAGVTNRAFRRLCREQGAALYTSEMITARALVEQNPKTMGMATFDPDESPRSIQLYGVDPVTMGAAVRSIVTQDRADHIDLNMGCPVPKVTRRGGGAALPWKTELFKAIIQAAVTAAAQATDRQGRPPIPVTVKMRLGVDDEHLTYLDAGRAAAEAGVAWVALHARTCAQLYSGVARWEAIGQLTEELAPMGVPVLGNGDIWTASDAVRMIDQTSCAGVVVGRGCLGRPWLFAQLTAALNGQPVPADPNLAQVCAVMFRHAQLMTDCLGETKGCRELRKHVAWYLKGFVVGQRLRAELAAVSQLGELRELLNQLDRDQPYDPQSAAGPRGRTSGQRTVALPSGWLDSRVVAAADQSLLSSAEIDVSGG